MDATTELRDTTMPINDTRLIAIPSRDARKVLRIEAPGCLITIEVGLMDADGREITSVSIAASDDPPDGGAAWRVNGNGGGEADGVTVIHIVQDAI